MPLVDLYSNRNTSQPEIWTFDAIPDRLRVQVVNILQQGLGIRNPRSEYTSYEVYKAVSKAIAHEHGISSLSGQLGTPEDVLGCIARTQNVALWLDCVELTCTEMVIFQESIQDFRFQYHRFELTAHAAIAELNERFRRAGFGYRYESEKIIRIDSEAIYKLAMQPALELLSDARFAGANDEFRAAHDHFKAGEYKDCAVDALNALESTMKSICDIRGWSYQKGARSSDLLKILRHQKFFPEYLDQSFEQLIATLKSGLPVLRNETGGHGQGSEPTEVPQYVAAYALNLAGSKIVLLVNALNA